MKAAEFDYARAGTVEEVCRLLDGAAGDGKIIAGGQTLVPLLVMRLARPSLVIDINRVAALHGIAETVDGVVIKAATRQADALTDDVVQRRLEVYEHLTEPVVDFYRSRRVLIEVDGALSIERVFAAEIEALSKLGLSPLTRMS